MLGQPHAEAGGIEPVLQVVSARVKRGATRATMNGATTIVMAEIRLIPLAEAERSKFVQELR